MGYARPMEYSRMMPRMANRKQFPWSREIWNRTDQAVHDECKRTKIAAKFLPMYSPISPLGTTVPSDRVVFDGQTLAIASRNDSTHTNSWLITKRSPERSVNSNTTFREEHYNGTQLD